MCIAYKDILEIILTSPEGVGLVEIEDLSASIARFLNVQLTADDSRALGKLLTRLKVKWKAAHRRKDRFLCKNQKWVKRTFCLSESVCRPSSADGSTARGRRPLPFPEMSHRSKLRATEELRHGTSSETLVFATASNLQKDGRRLSGRLIQAVASPTRGSVIAECLAKSDASITQYTPEDALALLVAWYCSMGYISERSIMLVVTNSLYITVYHMSQRHSGAVLSNINAAAVHQF